MGWSLGLPSALPFRGLLGAGTYWFLDPHSQSGGALLLGIAVLIAAVGVIALLLIAIDRWKGRQA